MSEEPIRAGQGIYTAAGRRNKQKGVCVAFDDNGIWDIKEAKDGSIIILIPPDSKWKVTTEQPLNTQRKIVIFREGATVRREGPFLDSDEIHLGYTHPAD
ncbi:MAG: hypothetical protein IPM55_20650 [Acidobacteria bacterium]|nr:hypothetical protein [Acidobacteriota bacterium]